MSQGFLRVRNWAKYQHYKGLKPRKLHWVKYHLDQLDDEVFLALPYAAQLLFSRLLLLEAKAVNNGRRGFRDDCEWIAARVRMSVETVGEMLPHLLAGGWLVRSKTDRADPKPKAEGSESEGEANAPPTGNGNGGGANTETPEPTREGAWLTGIDGGLSASSVLDDCYQNACLEVEKEERESNPSAVNGGEKEQHPDFNIRESIVSSLAEARTKGAA